MEEGLWLQAYVHVILLSWKEFDFFSCHITIEHIVKVNKYLGKILGYCFINYFPDVPLTHKMVLELIP